jgi:hypothetical protein
MFGKTTLLMLFLLAVMCLVAAAWLDAIAAENALFGKWQITDAALAPWAAKQKGQSAETRKLLNMQMTFAAKTMKSNYPTLNCSDASFAVESDPPDVLFQGALSEPNQASVAESMGFPRGDIPSVEVNCSSGDFPFHFRDADTVLFALNDVIYTLKRR